jgi:hypothetical protein
MSMPRSGAVPLTWERSVSHVPDTCTIGLLGELRFLASGDTAGVTAGNWAGHRIEKMYLSVEDSNEAAPAAVPAPSPVSVAAWTEEAAILALARIPRTPDGPDFSRACPADVALADRLFCEDSKYLKSLALAEVGRRGGALRLKDRGKYLKQYSEREPVTCDLDEGWDDAEPTAFGGYAECVDAGPTAFGADGGWDDIVSLLPGLTKLRYSLGNRVPCQFRVPWQFGLWVCGRTRTRSAFGSAPL